ncbi:hypothetical protein CcaCcLH18_02143 [Colletotrichum camelliae]|nr:hypothetical protein CcaCcLH18_02143 [Colletotrichum camelliae]
MPSTELEIHNLHPSSMSAAERAEDDAVFLTLVTIPLNVIRLQQRDKCQLEKPDMNFLQTCTVPPTCM